MTRTIDLHNLYDLAPHQLFRDLPMHFGVNRGDNRKNTLNKLIKITMNTKPEYFDLTVFKTLVDQGMPSHVAIIIKITHCPLC